MGEVIYDIRSLEVGHEHTLLAHFSSIVNEGELVLLVGRNGAGKSTLLNTLKGTHKSSNGTVQLLGRELINYSVLELSKVVAVVNTSRPILSGWSVKDVLQSTLDLTTKSSREQLLERAANLCQIEDILTYQVDHLSDGEFQKVMIARAICQQTKVIILDEPTSFLDVIYRERILEIFNELKTSFNTTLILSSHNFEPLLKIASRVWVLHQNEIQSLEHSFDYKGIINKLK